MATQVARGRALILAGGGLALAAIAAVVYRFDPAHHAFFPRCLFYMFTGLTCPGCGTTRAIHELLHGNLAEAFRFNPLLLLFYLPILVFVAGVNLNRFLRRESLIDLAPGRHGGWAIVCLIVGFWIVRNTAIYPFP